jgi:hypothetical protein
VALCSNAARTEARTRLLHSPPSRAAIVAFTLGQGFECPQLHRQKPSYNQRSAYNHPPPQHVVSSRAARRPSGALYAHLRWQSMQDPANELRRIPLPRTPVHKPVLESSPPIGIAAQTRDDTARALPAMVQSTIRVVPRGKSHSLSHPRCNLVDSHRANNKPAGRNDAAFDTTASRTQYPPAITEGGLPAGR